MSQENVEIVRGSLQAFVEGGLDAMAGFWAADINWRAMEGAIDDVGEIQGAEALRRYYEDWLDMFDDVTNVPEELIDLGDDRVLAVQRHRPRKSKRRRNRASLRRDLHGARWEDLSRARIQRPQPGPRGRRAAGVGDVAGER
jgi:ketosteroid isomerase-like protein